MRTPRRVTVALAALVGVLVTFLVPSPASAAYYGSETDYGVYSWGPTESYICAPEWESVKVCFKPYGDHIYVRDGKVDGWAAVAEWRFYDNDHQFQRSGSCVNKQGGGDWAECNKNFTEDGYLYFRPALYDSGNRVGWLSDFSQSART